MISFNKVAAEDFDICMTLPSGGYSIESCWAVYCIVRHTEIWCPLCPQTFGIQQTQTVCVSLSHLKVDTSSFRAGGWMQRSLCCNLPPPDNVQFRCIWEATPISSVIHQFHNLYQPASLSLFLSLSASTLILPASCSLSPCLYRFPSLTHVSLSILRFSVFLEVIFMYKYLVAFRGFYFIFLKKPCKYI